jgi:hypothetical protein
MHLIVPFASVVSEAGRQAATTLELPHLQRLLASATPVDRLGGDEMSLTPPHELAFARHCGWHFDDGRNPWAAQHAPRDGIDPAAQAWGWLTPVHLHLGTEQVSMADPETLSLDERTARELFDSVLALFESEGFVLRFATALRWYLSHPSLAELPTASLDRVIGRRIDAWLPDAPAARLVRRLQSEVQMLWYGHAVNDRREAEGLLPVNSLWLSGCGVAADMPEPAQAPQRDDRLRTPALAEDWAAWCEAWRLLDAGPLAALARSAAAGTLTLAGERHAASYALGAASWWQRWRAPSPVAVLESL